MSQSKRLVTALVFLVIGIGVIAITLQLSRQSQDTRSRAVVDSSCMYDSSTDLVICPDYVSPHPDFCLDGTIIYQAPDVCGCQLPPVCLPSTSADDLYFDLRNLFFTITDASTSSATLTTSNICQLSVSKQYTVDIQYNVQNTNKTITPESVDIIAQLQINDVDKGTVTIPYDMIVYHQDGASYPFTNISFTPQPGENTIQITLDTTNVIDETNEQNNTYTKTFNVTTEESCTNTPSYDYNQDGTINLLDYNLFLNAWLETFSQ